MLQIFNFIFPKVFKNGFRNLCVRTPRRGLAAAKHVNKTTLNTRNRALSPRKGPEGASGKFRNEMNIVSQIGKYFAWQHLVYQTGDLELHSSSHRQPIQLTHYRCYVVATFMFCDQPCRRILHPPCVFVGQFIQLINSSSCNSPIAIKWKSGLVS